MGFARIAVPAAVAGLASVLRRQSLREARPGRGILELRYSQGEIDEEEYRRRLAVLEGAGD